MSSKSVYLKCFARTQKCISSVQNISLYFRFSKIAICQDRKEVELNILINTFFNPEGLIFRTRNIHRTLQITTSCDLEN
jgi:hypothetical protein